MIQSGSRVFMTQNWKQFTAGKKMYTFFLLKIAICKFLGLHKYGNIQATGEAFSPQKWTSSTSKREILNFFYFCWYFLPSWIWIRIQIRIYWPDWTRIESGSETLDLRFHIWMSIRIHIFLCVLAPPVHIKCRRILPHPIHQDSHVVKIECFTHSFPWSGPRNT